ncbi:conjugal transfer pilus assembly protein TraU [Photobacterium carnosum]|uniref:conjugal transfer pilus assembly protein TraU n=1 Tax=Photobacterium carnosum TaxID=2023717 RepID=UPI001E441597|nr:conjugal transfer pilus assembly protein TraU [Photobacterium carnosum]MCD9524169.1 conjugal transfer pilus assembly protein TraU [Photobacterium carnosum]
MLKLLSWVVGLCLLATTNTASASGPACRARFMNPITDICWECIFPITLGSVPLIPSKRPDTKNPTMPISFCPKPPPIFMQVGLNIGYWEPYAITDVTRVPFCMVNLGFSLGGGMSQQIGGASTHKDKADGSDGAFYQAHWYKYPLIYWLQILQSTACMSLDNFDIGYLTELDPFWDDDELSFILNPEVILFGNPIAQLACVAESVKTSAGSSLPIDALFWCMGSQGSAYPLTGNTTYRDTPMQSAVLMAERLNYKLHRQGIVWESLGTDGAVCYQHPMPILPKSRYRYQLSNVIPNATNCYPYGTTTAIWESGHDNPVTGDNFGFVQWRKRNCVFL